MKVLLLASAVLLAACSGADVASSGGGGSGEGGATSVSSGAGDGGTGPGAPSTATTGGGGPTLGPQLCPAPDASVTEGVAVGERLPPFVVRDCAGGEVSLDAFCGAEALWIFAAHGWCPLCRNVSGGQEAILADYEALGLVAINVVVEDAQSNTPDGDYCALWRETHGHDRVFTLYDPTGEILDLWPGGSTSLSAFVGSDRVIRSKLQYESSEAAIRAEIDGALGP